MMDDQLSLKTEKLLKKKFKKNKMNSYNDQQKFNDALMRYSVQCLLCKLYPIGLYSIVWFHHQPKSIKDKTGLGVAADWRLNAQV